MRAVLKTSNSRRWVHRVAWWVVIAVMVRGSYPEFYLLPSLRTDADFWGYFTASTLIQHHRPMVVYEEAARDIDPVEQRAMPDTEFARTARSFGLSGVGLYDYPPTLADLLLPMTYLPPLAALLLWELLNLAATVAGAAVLISMLEIRGAAGRVLTVALVLLFRPTLDSLAYGQLAGIWFLILIAGLSCYERGRRNGAAFLFALGAAIKMTPLILFVPLIARKDWRTVRLFVAWCAAIFAALVLVNGWPMLDLYFIHELPRMATKILDDDNRTLGSLLQILLQRSTEGPQLAATRLLARFVSAIVLVWAGWWSLRDRHHALLDSTGFETPAIFLLFACCLAPVAWLNVYEIAIPALALVAIRIREGKSSMLELSAFVAFMIAASTERYRWLGITMPLFAVILGLTRLHALRAKCEPDLHPAGLTSSQV